MLARSWLWSIWNVQEESKWAVINFQQTTRPLHFRLGVAEKIENGLQRFSRRGQTYSHCYKCNSQMFKYVTTVLFNDGKPWLDIMSGLSIEGGPCTVEICKKERRRTGTVSNI